MIGIVRTRSAGRPGRILILTTALALLVGMLVAAPAAQAAPAPTDATASATATPMRAAPATATNPAAAPASRHGHGHAGLGPNVYVFTPAMKQSTIQATVDRVADQQLSNQFGTQRYALLFEPGTYGSAENPLRFEIGYYTEVAGLGAAPGDVVVNGSIDVYNQCREKDCNALTNFWRSLSNLTINVMGGTGCGADTEFWAVSQAAPMRRVQVNGGVTLMDYCSGGSAFSSGGYIADSAFSAGSILNGSQQQFLVRNSSIDGWSNGVWNQVFSGVVNAPAQSFGEPGASPYTTLPTSPITQEKPFLYSDDGDMRVFVPAVRHDSTGTSWADGTTAGRSLPLRRFFIATPRTPVFAINVALALGKNLLLTPGVYSLKHTIHVRRPNTIVLGLGFPTLVPEHGIDAMDVASVPGVKLGGMIFDAGTQNSRALLRVGSSHRRWFPSRSTAPVLVQDVFFRIGGAAAGSATDSLIVNSSNVILDDVWAWRADHGEGVGWTKNTARTGVVVNGDDVTAYGLFVEHYQGPEVVWNGQRGTDIFFQNEMPYDVPSQDAWQGKHVDQGFPALYISPRVRSFDGYGMGSYSNFNQGVDIHASEGFTVPDAPDVQLHDVFTRFLNGSGGIDSVVNGTGDAVNVDNHGPSNVISYP